MTLVRTGEVGGQLGAKPCTECTLLTVVVVLISSWDRSARVLLLCKSQINNYWK